MKTVLSLLALSLLSTACGTAELSTYRFKESNVKHCVKGDWGGCITESTKPEVKKAPTCPKKPQPEVVVFLVDPSDEGVKEECIERKESN